MLAAKEAVKYFTYQLLALIQGQQKSLVKKETNRAKVIIKTRTKGNFLSREHLGLKKKKSWMLITFQAKFMQEKLHLRARFIFQNQKTRLNWGSQISHV